MAADGESSKEAGTEESRPVAHRSPPLNSEAAHLDRDYVADQGISRGGLKKELHL
jgi:hypothetical protein